MAAGLGRIRWRRSSKRAMGWRAIWAAGFYYRWRAGMWKQCRGGRCRHGRRGRGGRCFESRRRTRPPPKPLPRRTSGAASTSARPRKARPAERARRRRGTHERRGLFRGAVFGVRARVRVLAATAPGLLPRLATSCGETKVTAFDPRTREYTGFGAGCWLLLGGAMGPSCAC